MFQVQDFVYFNSSQFGGGGTGLFILIVFNVYGTRQCLFQQLLMFQLQASVYFKRSVCFFLNVSTVCFFVNVSAVCFFVNVSAVCFPLNVSAVCFPLNVSAVCFFVNVSALVPDNVKKELLQRIRTFLAQQS